MADENMVPEKDLLAVKAGAEKTEGLLADAKRESGEARDALSKSTTDLETVRAELATANEGLGTLKEVSDKLADSEKSRENLETEVVSTLTTQAKGLGVDEDVLKDKTPSELRLLIQGAGAKPADGNKGSDGGDGNKKPPPASNGSRGINVAKIGGDPSKARQFVGAGEGGGASGGENDIDYAKRLIRESNERSKQRAEAR